MPAGTDSSESPTTTHCAARLTADLAEMSTLERYSLVDDAWAATVAGSMSAQDLLEFLEGFSTEREHAVWQAVVIALRGLGRLVGDEARPAFESKVRDLGADQPSPNSANPNQARATSLPSCGACC